MEWSKFARKCNELNLERAKNLLTTLNQETDALKGHEDLSEEKYTAARKAMGGAAAIEAFRSRSENAARLIEDTRQQLTPSWIVFQSLGISDLYEHCSRAQIVFKETVQALISKLAEQGVVADLSAPSGLKKIERAIVKMQIKYGGDVSRLTDVFRCTLIFDSLKDLYAAVNLIAHTPTLRGPGGAVVTELADRFLNPLPKQYGDVLVQIVIDG